MSIFAVGKRGYTFGAANLAASIKHHAPDVVVDLYTDGAALKHLKPQHTDLFSSIVLIDEHNYTTLGKLDPGKLKCRVAGLILGESSLFVDADSIAVKDIRPLLRALRDDGRDFIVEVLDGYNPWVSPDKVRTKVGNLNAKVLPIQSSWFFLRKGEFFDKVRELSDSGYWKIADLDHKWGKSIPDELILSTACALMENDPSWRGEMLFGNKITAKTIDEVREQFSFITLYGNGVGRPHVRDIYIGMYDRTLHDIYKAKMMNHSFKSSYILADKYLN